MFSALFAAMVGCMCFLAFMLLLGSRPALAGGLAAGIFILTIGAIGGRHRLGPAAAIAIAAICSFLLMLGLCSMGPSVFYHPRPVATAPAPPAK